MRNIFSFENLRKYRDEHCLSQEYIANLLEVNQSTYQRMESGKIKLSTNHIEKLVNIFNRISVPFNRLNKDSTNKVELMKKAIIQLEKRIEELETNLIIKDLQIEELKKQIDVSL